MADITFQIIHSEDKEIIELIADWYLNEWKIPKEKTIQKLQSVTEDPSQFQVIMSLDKQPIATGGLYQHIGLHDKEPRFKAFNNWLALVYTIPEKRHHGLGEVLCNYIQSHSKKIGIKEMYLYTDTAERLYKRLGWTEMERLSIGGRSLVVMTKDL